MRNVILLFIVFCAVCFNANAQIGDADDTVRLGQMDGTVITIRGIGVAPLAYTETVDGYTIVLNNDGIYEYAKQAKDGDLLASGEKANNPPRRAAKEIKYLVKLPKHLRYLGAKLEDIQNKYKKLNRTPKKHKN